jgi:hypothetical protein
MHPNRLILVVCDELWSGLSQGKEIPIQLGHVKLLIHGDEDSSEKPEKFWHEGGLAAEIEATLNHEGIDSVRIAAHMSTVFPASSQHGFQVRFEKEEEELRRATGIRDLQVWGFRHELRYAPIWIALDAIRNASQQSHLDETTSEALGSKLDDAFKEAAAHLLCERFSIDRHCIMSLYVPIRLNLELAAEQARGRNADSIGLIQEVQQKFPAKSEEARRLFAQAMKNIQDFSPLLRRQLHEQERTVAKILDETPDLGGSHTASETFNAWLSRLHDGLDQLRNRLTHD